MNVQSAVGVVSVDVEQGIMMFAIIVEVKANIQGDDVGYFKHKE